MYDSSEYKMRALEKTNNFKIENCVAISSFMPLACVCVSVVFFIEFSVSLIRIRTSLAYSQTNERTDTRTHREVISRFGCIKPPFFSFCFVPKIKYA